MDFFIRFNVYCIYANALIHQSNFLKRCLLKATVLDLQTQDCIAEILERVSSTYII